MNFKKMHDVLTEGSYKSYKMLFYISAAVILSLACLVVILRKGTTAGEFIEGVSVESVGMLFDIFVLGFIFNYFYNKGEKKRELEKAEKEKQLKIDRYLEEIDDYRGWDEKEAMFRIVGNIRRLIKLGQKNLDLHHCYLQNANLFKADLHLADLRWVNLQGANLGAAKLQRAGLRGADLQEADLSVAMLQRAKLQGADLEGADLQGTDLDGADLQGAWLMDADLQGANLSAVNLMNTNLQNTNLHGANLLSADLKGARGLTIEMLLKVESLYGAKGLDPTLEKELKAQKPQLFEKPE